MSSGITNNLLLFLDPTGCRKEWRVQDWPLTWGKLCMAGGNAVFRFRRRQILAYLLCSFALAISGQKRRMRTVLFMNDGLLSCFFDASEIEAYRAFSRHHLPPPAGIRDRLRILLPPLWRAENRFIALYREPLKAPSRTPCAEAGFMFFSNPQGKLMLAAAQTLVEGKGTLLKTSASRDYQANLAAENRILSRIRGQGAPGVPSIGSPIARGMRRLYPEEYVRGDNLRESLRRMGRRGSSRDACAVVETLDRWYRSYHSTFSGERRPLPLLYRPVLENFLKAHRDEPVSRSLAQRASRILFTLAGHHQGVVAVTAHNDLWPGNVIAGGDGLTVVDWERATEGSAPFFDYCWMMISTAMEYRVGCLGSGDYSRCFRDCMDARDEVSRLVRRKIRDFVDDMGFAEAAFPDLIMLFLVEWSMQGFRSLREKTAMDALAFGELVKFSGVQADCGATIASSCEIAAACGMQA